MKNSISLKIGVMAACLLATQNMSASAEAAAASTEAVKEVFTRSGVLEKFAKIQLSSLVTTPEGLATTAFMISLFVFFSREPDKKPNRYNIEEVKADPSFRNIFKFVYYYLLDGVIGHVRQSSSSKIGEDGKTVELKPGIPARGFYGYVSELVKPIGKTFGFIKTTGEFFRDCVLGLVAWELLVKAEQKL